MMKSGLVEVYIAVTDKPIIFMRPLISGEYGLIPLPSPQPAWTREHCDIDGMFMITVFKEMGRW